MSKPSFKAFVLGELVDLAGHEFLLMLEWNDRLDPEEHFYAHRHLIRAEFLIELVEAQDSGTVGGFGHEQRDAVTSKVEYSDKHPELFARWLWLQNRYPFEGKNRRIKNGSLEHLKRSFTHRPLWED